MLRTLLTFVMFAAGKRERFFACKDEEGAFAWLLEQRGAK
mgnify:CR=1 FL=1